VYATPVTTELSVHDILDPDFVGWLAPVHTATAEPLASERITVYVMVRPLEIATAVQDNEMEFGRDVGETTGATVGEKVAPAN
jgi:hypothetical protein